MRKSKKGKFFHILLLSALGFLALIDMAGFSDSSKNLAVNGDSQSKSERNLINGNPAMISLGNHLSSFSWPLIGKQDIIRPDPASAMTVSNGASYPSLQEIQGLSGPSNVWYFPYYDSIDSNSADSDFVILTNSAQVSTSVTVSVYTSSKVYSWQGTLNSLSNQYVTFPNIKGGPVVVNSSVPIFSIQKVVSGVTDSIINGTPTPSTVLMWPSYDSTETVGQYSDWIVIANPPSNSSPAYVSLSVGTTQWSPSSPIEPGTYSYVEFTNLNASPVVLTSNIGVVASQRLILADSNWPGNLTELLGISISSASSFGYGTSLYWSVYDSEISPSAAIQIANPPNSSQPALVNIKLGNVTYLTSQIAPGLTDTVNLPSLSVGPVELSSNVAVVAVESELLGNTLVEVPGIAQTSSVVVLPFYDSLSTPNQNESWLIVSNPTTNSCQANLVIQNANIATTLNISPFSLSYSIFPSLNVGPVVISSSCSVFASERIIYGPSAPEVNSINPEIGSVSGNTTVTVSGVNFVGPLKLFLGKNQINNFNLNSSNQIVFKTPPEPAGSYPIYVENMTGTSQASAQNIFTFVTNVGKFPPGTTGYDISWPQCPNNFPSPPGVISIIGADDGFPFSNNPCLLNEISWSGGTYNLYAVIFWDGQQSYGSFPLNCATDNTISCYAYNWGWNAAKWIFNQTASIGVTSEVWWLDIEGAYGSSNPLWSSNVYANAYTVQGAVDFFSSQYVPNTNIKEQVGIYSSPCEWPQIVPGTDTGPSCTDFQGYMPNALEWVANWNNPSNPGIYCSSLYSFTQGPIWLVQYTDNQGGFDGDYSC